MYLTLRYTLKLDSQQIAHKLVLYSVAVVSTSLYSTYSCGGDFP